MPFISVLPANIVKIAQPRLAPRPSSVLCNYAVLYVSMGDIVDPENHRYVLDALRCVAGRVLSLSETVM